MPVQPAIKRTIAFVDGQNLFYAARECFGYRRPTYDVRALAGAVCASRDWQLGRVHFYTGIPDPGRDPRRHAFWTSMLASMGRRQVVTFTRPLRYHQRVIPLPGGGSFILPTAEEKGVDVRLALDVIRFANRSEYDVALIFSQDQDLSEVAEEVRVIAREQGRWIKIASAFPCLSNSSNRRGIDKTDWIRIDRSTYDACLDTYDHRPKRRGPS